MVEASTLIAVAALAFVLNILDSATTYVGFRQYPEKDLRGELNPVMRWLMLRNKWLAEIIKQGGMLALVLYTVFQRDIYPLRLFVLVLGFVVLNNSYTIATRAVLRRRTISPGRAIQKLLHLSDGALYIVMLVIVVGLALGINGIFWGWK